MTVINPKSISGITSITTPAGSDNLFTVHTNDTTERFRIDASGHQNISGIVTAANFKTGTSNLHNTGLNVQDLDVDGHTNLDNVSIVGVTTFNGLSTNDVIRVRAADTNGVSVINILAEGTTGHSRIKFSDTAGTDGQISYTHTDRALTFATAGTTERLRITSNGVLKLTGQSTSFETAGFTHHTNNNLYI